MHRSAPHFVLTLVLITGCQGTHNSGQPVGDELQADTIKAHALTPCPDHNNCVSSLMTGEDHRIAALPIGAGDDKAVMARLKKAVLALPRATIRHESSTYLHATLETAVFRFVDDLELMLDRPHHVVQVRSASRFGSYDWGSNRQRVEALRAALQAP